MFCVRSRVCFRYFISCLAQGGEDPNFIGENTTSNLRQVNFEYFILRSNISNVQPCFCKNFGVTQVINKLKGGRERLQTPADPSPSPSPRSTTAADEVQMVSFV